MLSKTFVVTDNVFALQFKSVVRFKKEFSGSLFQVFLTHRLGRPDTELLLLLIEKPESAYLGVHDTRRQVDYKLQYILQVKI